MTQAAHSPTYGVVLELLEVTTAIALAAANTANVELNWVFGTAHVSLPPPPRSGGAEAR